MNEIQIFENSEFGEVRTVTIGDEPWFVGKDICQIFGDTNHNRSLSRVAEEDKRVDEIIDALGRKQAATFVNESGLYSLLFSMQPQKANHNGVSDAYPITVQERIEKLHRFKRWVTSEVLPAIRKHGVFAVDEVLANPDILINALMELKKEREEKSALQQTVAVQNQQISEMQPKASYYDVVLNCKELVPISVIAKDYGWTANKLNRFLGDKRVQFNQGGIWLLYKEYAEMGYTSTKTMCYNGRDGETHTNVHTYWTQKGRLFVYNLMKENNILPIVER